MVCDSKLTHVHNGHGTKLKEGVMARVRTNALGSGIVEAVGRRLKDVRAERDRDGVEDECIRYWRVPTGTQVGAFVILQSY